MKPEYLYLKNCLSGEETEKLLGKFLDSSHYDFVVDEDMNVFKPAVSPFEDPQLLLSFRKNVFPKSLTRIAYEALKDAAKPTNNRGLAGGPVTDWNRDNPNIIQVSDNLIRYTNTGINVGNSVNSGIVGYVDRYPRTPYCRTTAFTEKNLEKFENSIPFIQAISEQFKNRVPERYFIQKRFSDLTPDFTIKGTVFSTVTVNKNFRTAGHYDAGDLEEGFGNLVVLESEVGFRGGLLVFPKYRVAVNVREGDFLAMDVHELHGNTEIIGDEGFERVSVVCYYRRKIQNCGTREQEDLKRKRFESGLTPEEVQEMRIL